MYCCVHSITVLKTQVNTSLHVDTAITLGFTFYDLSLLIAVPTCYRRGLYLTLPSVLNIVGLSCFSLVITFHFLIYFSLTKLVVILT